LKELRKSARSEIGGLTTTLLNGGNITQYRNNKISSRAARNKLTIPIHQPMIDLVDDDENSDFVESNDSHVEAAVGGSSNIIERMKKRVTRTIMSKDTTPESKKKLRVVFHKLVSENNGVVIESVLTCPEEATSEDRLEHLKFMVGYDDDGKQA